MKSFGGEFTFNPDKTPCITGLSRANIKTKLQNNIDKLEALGKLSYPKFSSEKPSFIRPKSF